MNIVDVRSIKLSGCMLDPEKFVWKERGVSPLDIYPKYMCQGHPGWDGIYPTQKFLEVVADDGTVGIYGPIQEESILHIIDNVLKRHLIGEDPFCTEKLWDIMYRSQAANRRGDTIKAISAVDIALWDLKGKAIGQAVVKLLGGPTKEKLPAYVSTIGHSIEPDNVTKTCQQFVEEGFTAMKWYFRYGPSSGLKGVKKNIELVQTVRDAVGYDVELMMDCCTGWTLNYALKMGKLLERYELAWLEEPLMPHDMDGYAELSKKLDIPIACGEKEYTRWGFREIINRHAASILQPDVSWVGGITEMMKICALASAEGIPVIPHTAWIEPSLCIVFSQPEYVCPMVEFISMWSVLQQAYLGHLKPERGYFMAPMKLGVGFELEKEKIVRT